MATFSWFRWLRSLFRSRLKPFRKPRNKRRSLHLEHLESRLAPATFTWIGGAVGGNLWSIAANWAAGAAPTTTTPLDNLVFGNTNPNNGTVISAFNRKTIDDISSVNVGAVQITSSNYDISPKNPLKPTI